MQHTDDHDDGQQHRRECNDAVYELPELSATGKGLTFKGTVADSPWRPFRLAFRARFGPQRQRRLAATGALAADCQRARQFS
jgi:hypothetical protein